MAEGSSSQAPVTRPRPSVRMTPCFSFVAVWLASFGTGLYLKSHFVARSVNGAGRAAAADRTTTACAENGSRTPAARPQRRRRFRPTRGTKVIPTGWPYGAACASDDDEAAMSVTRPLLTGNAQSRTDTVERAIEILKDREMPRPKADLRQNIGPRWKKPTPHK
jgi:hypothetical protein